MKTSEITLKLSKKLSFAILDNFNFEVGMTFLRLQFNCPFKCKKFQMGIQRHLELFKFEPNYLYLLVELFMDGLATKTFHTTNPIYVTVGSRQATSA